jgi:transcriptional regulator with XRE-family HTH domain
MPLLRRLIGAALRRARLRQERTLREVAAAARVSLPYLSEVERGRKEASSEVLAAICAALDLRLGDLLTEVQDELFELERAAAPPAALSSIGFSTVRTPPPVDGRCSARHARPVVGARRPAQVGFAASVVAGHRRPALEERPPALALVS